jgi:hypothetical protein
MHSLLELIGIGQVEKRHAGQETHDGQPSSGNDCRLHVLFGGFGAHFHFGFNGPHVALAILIDRNTALDKVGSSHVVHAVIRHGQGCRGTSDDSKD